MFKVDGSLSGPNHENPLNMGGVILEAWRPGSYAGGEVDNVIPGV